MCRLRSAEDGAGSTGEVRDLRAKLAAAERDARDANVRAQQQSDRIQNLREQMTSIRMKLLEETRRAERAERLLEQRSSQARMHTLTHALHFRFVCVQRSAHPEIVVFPCIFVLPFCLSHRWFDATFLFGWKQYFDIFF